MAIRYIDEQPQGKSKIRFTDEPQGTKPSFLDFVGIAQDIAPSPVSRIQSGLDVAGENIAEALGRSGRPVLGAGLGTTVSMIPELLASGTTIAAMERSPSTLARAIRTTPSEFNAEFRAGEKAAGITDVLPVQRGAKPRFQPNPSMKSLQLPTEKPISYPKDTPSFVNFAKARMRGFGDKLSPNEVDDYAKVATTTLDKLEGQGLRNTPLFAAVADLKTMATNLRNEVIPGRSELNKVYALSRKLNASGLKEAIAGLSKRYGKKALEGAILGGSGAYAAKKVFQP